MRNLPYLTLVDEEDEDQLPLMKLDLGENFLAEASGPTVEMPWFERVTELPQKRLSTLLDSSI